MSDSGQAAVAGSATGPPIPPRRLWRAFAWTLVAMALPALLALVLAALMWAAGSVSGTAWLLGRMPGLTATAPKGSLAGSFSAERLEITLPGGAAGDRLVIAGLRWRAMSLVSTPSNATWLRLVIDGLHADRVDVLLAPDPDAAALTPPQSLQLPIEIEARAIDIAAIHAPALSAQPLLRVRGDLHLSADAGRAHRIDGLSLAWDRLAARGAAQIASVAPFAVQAQAAIEPHPAEASPAAARPPAFDATLKLSGPLARLDLQATLRGTARGGRKGAAAPSLDLRATVLPFAAWPLAALQAQTRALDLAALHSSAPATSISGTADVASAGTDLPATVAVVLANAGAGRFDEGLLPLRSLRADLRTRPDDPRQIDIHALDVALGTARAGGGRLTGNGRWTPRRASLTLEVSDIEPRVLDSRAPQMHFSGRGEVLADDWFGNGASTQGGAQPSLALRGRVDGSLLHDGRREVLQLELDAMATSQGLALRSARLQAGDSHATLSGEARRQARGDWQLKGQGTLADFNPALWWPGPQGSAWRKGPHRFNGRLDLDALLAPQAGNEALSLQRLATSQGRATLRITDSLLAGAPLTGEFALRGEGAAGLGVSGSLDLAGTSLTLRGRLDPAAQDHWEIDARAADLAPWSPLLQLLQPAAKAAPVLAGALGGEMRFDGRWPRLDSHGQIGLKNARASTLRLASATLRWTASTLAQAPLDVQAEVEQMSLDATKLDNLRLSVLGTAAEHRIALSAASPVRPPKWIELLQGAASAAPPAGAGATAPGTLAALRAQGGLELDTSWHKPLRWQGRLQGVDLHHRGGTLATPWFHVGDLAVAAQYDPLDRTPRVTLSPGRAELPNLALRWNQLRWQGGDAPQLDVQAEVEPFSVAPLLARLQPDFGWGGDLVLAGQINVHSAPGFVAEVEFGRQRGDLHVTDEAGTQPLELTDLRLALDAQDGVWHFTQALAGKSLGSMAGAATVRTDPKALWPPASAPLQGVAEVRVANLATWGAWFPAGWRLKGALHAGASFGGQFGSPEYTGQIDGSGLGARNLVEGIDLHDGELAITLEGETARIGTLQARAGDGSLQISGGATFGASPQAKLRAVADKMLLLGRVDRRAVVSGDATLQLDARNLKLDGRFIVDQGMFDFSRGNAPGLGDDVHVMRESASRGADAATPRPAPVRDVKMNLALNLGPALRLRGRGLDTRLQGELMLTAPESRLAVHGTVNAVQGTYRAYGQNLSIERGAVTFLGAIDNPRLDILALRPNVDIQVGVAISGSAGTPRIALFSEPDLPDNHKLSWLMLGRAPEGLPGSDTALLQAAAMAVLAGEGDGPASALAKLNPLDTLSMRQTDGAVRETIVSVGKQLSQRWYIGYERSLNATAGNWQLIYRLAQRFTVRLQTGLDNSIDLIWSWRWD